MFDLVCIENFYMEEDNELAFMEGETYTFEKVLEGDLKGLFVTESEIDDGGPHYMAMRHLQRYFAKTKNLNFLNEGDFKIEL